MANCESCNERMSGPFENDFTLTAVCPLPDDCLTYVIANGMLCVVTAPHGDHEYVAKVARWGLLETVTNVNTRKNKEER